MKLARILAGGSDEDRVRALRALVARGWGGALGPLVRDPVPAIRREAVLGLGLRGQPEGLAALLTREPTWTVRAAVAVALGRCDIPAVAEPAAVRTRDGERHPDRALGLGVGLGDAEQALHAMEARVLWPRVPDDRQALEALGAVCAASEVPRLLALDEILGKRERNSWLLALGRSGDPRCVPVLTASLQRMAVDPARGFAERRLSALGLGRMGLPSLGPVLLRAYRREGDEEGHPGAGLGVQYPVRAVLVWAMGECQVASAAGLLCSLLDERSGTAFGGLYLPAMGALLKLGETARPELERVRGPGEDQARLLLAQIY